MMEFGLLALGALAIAAWLLRGSGRCERPQISPISDEAARGFSAAPSLFVNRSEAAFFHALRRALPAHVCLHSKVRMEDIVGVRRDIDDGRLRWHLRGRVKSRHVDFLITDLGGRPLRVIELDGPAHRGAAADVNDRVKNAIFAACGLPVLRVETGEDFQQICRQIAADLPRHNLAA